jgi:hypothetical protein
VQDISYCGVWQVVNILFTLFYFINDDGGLFPEIRYITCNVVLLNVQQWKVDLLNVNLQESLVHKIFQIF